MRNILLLALVVIFAGKSTVGGANPPPKLLEKPMVKTEVTDPLFEKAWHLEHSNILEAWKTSIGSSKVTLAIVDSGINYNHPDIAPNLRWKKSEWPMNGIDDDGNGFIDDVIGWDFISNGPFPFDRSGHGTFMAATAAGAYNNGIGSSGVCPKCSLIAFGFLNYKGLGDTEDAIRGIEGAIREKVSIINLSFGAQGYHQNLKEALEAAGEADIVAVVAAGNNAENIDYGSWYPAKFQMPHLITVAASTDNDDLLSTSSYGENSVHLAAPGYEIPGPWKEGWDLSSGTSDAASVVTGAAGLIRSAAPHLSAREVVQILTATARPSAALENKTKSGGVLDVSTAMKCATSKNLFCLRD
jgi:thermitase